MDENKKQPKEIVESAEPTLPELSEAALQQVAGGTNQTDAPTDSVNFAFGKIKVSYEEQ
jgi:hypothetical protein